MYKILILTINWILNYINNKIKFILILLFNSKSISINKMCIFKIKCTYFCLLIEVRTGLKQKVSMFSHSIEKTINDVQI